jgi:biotin carboxyl carrier protein
VRFRVQIDGTEHQILAGADGGLMVGADKFETTVTRSAADRMMVQVGDKSYEVRVIENSAESGTYVLELAGERVPIAVTGVSKGGGAAARIASRTVTAGAAPGPTAAAAVAPSQPVVVEGEAIRAPMPGRIVNVLVQVGDAVEAGDVVIILEAMKMENELRAPRKGTVTSVLVKKGDPAEGGQLLIALE